MQICQFNTFPYGGAAYAARRLHDSLRDDGVDSRFYYWKNNGLELDESYRELTFEKVEGLKLFAPLVRQQKKIRQRKIKKRYDKHIRPRSKDMEVFSGAQLLEETRLDWDQYGGDIAHLHWMAFFVDYASFFASIPDEVPIVWTLHDMNPLTGGCHYSSGCTRFMLGCGSCPQLTESHSNDESSETFKIKKRAIRRKNLTVVTPSKWMMDLASNSTVFPENTDFRLIRYGFDLQSLSPMDARLSRKMLGIPESDAVYIGFGAEDINHHRKGFNLLVESLQKINSDTRIECIVFGSGSLPENLSGLPKIHSTGFIDSPEMKAAVYSAMDFFVLPSLEDNSPQTGLEAMACGRPVVAFNTGGVPEYVVPHHTGLLSPVGNSNQLAATISWLAENQPAMKTMGERARKFVEDRYGLAQQSSKYCSLYEELLGMNQTQLGYTVRQKSAA